MHAKLLKILVLTAAVVVSQQAAALDVLELKAGGELKGSIIKTEDASIVFDTLPGRVTILRKNISAIKKLNDPDWYLQRIENRDAAQSVKILEHALMSGEASDAIRAKYVELSLAEAERNLAEKLPAAASEYCMGALFVQPGQEKATRLLTKCNRLQERTIAEVKALEAEVAQRHDNEYARFMLGEAYRKLGKNKEAFAQYQKIVEGKVAFEGGVEKMEQLRKFIADHLQVTDVAVTQKSGVPADAPQLMLKLGNLQVFYYDKSITNSLARNLPTIYRKVARNLSATSKTEAEAAKLPCVIRILRNRSEFINATGNRFGDGYHTKGCIWTYHGAGRMLENVLPHEMAHAIMQQTVGHLPNWIDEGLAVRQETSAGTYWVKLREAGRLPLTKLLQDFTPADKQENDLFYASAFSIVDMLLQDEGMTKLYRLIDELKDEPAAQAIKTVYGVASLRELDARWEKYLEE